MHKTRIILIAMVALIVSATLVVMDPAPGATMVPEAQTASATSALTTAPMDPMAEAHHCDACPDTAGGSADMAHAGGCSSGAGCLVLSLPQARALPLRLTRLAALDPPSPGDRPDATAPSLDLPPPRA